MVTVRNREGQADRQTCRNLIVSIGRGGTEEDAIRNRVLKHAVKEAKEPKHRPTL